MSAAEESLEYSGEELWVLQVGHRLSQVSPPLMLAFVMASVSHFEAFCRIFLVPNAPFAVLLRLAIPLGQALGSCSFSSSLICLIESAG
jgi:hypothetical protein